MSEPNPIDPAPVARITVDELLAEDLIRILVAPLKAGRASFTDEAIYWEDEQDVLIIPQDYRDIMGMSLANARRYPWDSLYEGQVFLVGSFKLDSTHTDGRWYSVETDRKYLRCINRFIKNDLKKQYLTALEGRVDDDYSNKSG